MTDETTSHFHLPLPHAGNTLAQDVARLRAALRGIDGLLSQLSADVAAVPSETELTALFAGKANAAHTHDIEHINGMVAALAAKADALATSTALAGKQDKPTHQIKTAAFTAVDGGDYACNTSGGAFTVTPPAAPVPGTRFRVRDYGRTFDAANLTVATGKVLGVAESYVLDVKDASRAFVYIDATVGWMVTQ